MKQYKLILAAALLVLSSCSTQDKQAKILKINIGSDPATLDPASASDVTSVAVVQMCFDGLVRKNLEGHPTLSIAERFTCLNEGSRYLFQLKKTQWSDGAPLTAHDFVFAWKRALSPSFPATISSELFAIKNGLRAKNKQISLDEIGINAIDDYTLEITLEHPTSHFLELLCCHCFSPYPKHIDGNDKRDLLVGNGPFIIQHWKHNDLIELKKNLLYHDLQSVKLDGLKLFMVSDPITELSLFEKDQLDWAGSPLSALPPESLLKKEKIQELRSLDLAGTSFYIFNTACFPFTNKHIRRAFSLCIPRQQITQEILCGGQEPAAAIVPPTLWPDQSQLFPLQDIALAHKELDIGLKELNISKKQLPKIFLSYNSGGIHHQIAQVIQHHWSKYLGIEVSLDLVEWKVLLDKIESGSFQIARSGCMATSKDPIFFFKDFLRSTKPSLHLGWHSENFCKLIALSDSIRSDQVRIDTLKQAQKAFIDEMPIVPLYFYKGHYLKKRHVHNIRVSDLFDIDFKYCDINR